MRIINPLFHSYDRFVNPDKLKILWEINVNGFVKFHYWSPPERLVEDSHIQVIDCKSTVSWWKDCHLNISECRWYRWSCRQTCAAALKLVGDFWVAHSCRLSFGQSKSIRTPWPSYWGYKEEPYSPGDRRVLPRPNPPKIKQTWCAAGPLPLEPTPYRWLTLLTFSWFRPLLSTLMRKRTIF